MIRPSIKNLFLIIMLLAGLLALVVILVYHSILIRVTEGTANENQDFVISQVSQNLNTYFSELDSSTDLIIFDNGVHLFLQANSSVDAYRISQPVRETMDSVFSNSATISSAILFSDEGSFYRYGNFFTNQTCRDLFMRFNTSSYTKNYTVEEIEGKAYFCLSQSIYRIVANRPEKVGMVVLLSDITDAHNYLASFNDLSDFTIAISDPAGHIFLSNRTEIEGGAIAEQPYFDPIINIVEQRKVSGSNLQLYVTRDKAASRTYQNIFVTAIIVILIVMAAVFVLATVAANRLFISPMSNVISQMRQKGVSNLKDRLSATKSPDIDRLVDDINALLDRSEDYSRRVFSTQQQLYETELKKHQLQLYVLRKQINTHFIFNTLNSIKALARENSQEPIAEISEGLANLLRYSYSTEEYINIFDEMQVIDQYVQIMNIRFGNKFKVEYDVDDTLCVYKILRLILQPIVENALMHGLEQKTDDCRLLITGRHDADAFVLTVTDNGAGIAPDLYREMQEKLNEEADDFSLTGIALVNINRRIHLYHGVAYGLRVESAPGAGTTVTVRLPLIEDAAFKA